MSEFRRLQLAQERLLARELGRQRDQDALIQGNREALSQKRSIDAVNAAESSVKSLGIELSDAKLSNEAIRHEVDQLAIVNESQRLRLNQERLITRENARKQEQDLAIKANQDIIARNANDSAKAEIERLKRQNEAQRLQLMQELSVLRRQTEITTAKLQLDLEKMKECVICQDADKTVVLFPCKHLVLCLKCKPLDNLCPICRSVVEERHEIKVP